MTVKELREFLATVPDDYTVLVGSKGMYASAAGAHVKHEWSIEDERFVVVWAP